MSAIVGEDKENSHVFADKARSRQDRQPFACKTSPNHNVQSSFDVKAGFVGGKTGVEDVEALQERWQQGSSSFEDRLADTLASDPVQIWSEYTNWAAEWKAEGPDFEIKAKVTVERACLALSAHECHRDDVRHLRLWVRHANNVQEPEDVFQLLEKQQIGLRHALLYEAWAACSEKKRDFKATEEAYQLGLHRQAQPVDRLQTRYQDFQARQERRAKRTRASAKRQAVLASQQMPSEETACSGGPPSNTRDKAIDSERATQAVVATEPPLASLEEPQHQVAERNDELPSSGHESANTACVGEEAIDTELPSFTAELDAQSVMVPITNADSPTGEQLASQEPAPRSVKHLVSQFSSNSLSSNESHTLKKVKPAKPEGWDPVTMSFVEKVDFYEAGPQNACPWLNAVEPDGSSTPPPRSASTLSTPPPRSSSTPPPRSATSSEDISKPILAFGPRDPAQESTSNRSRTSSTCRSKREDVSVEEMRAAWMLRSLQKPEAASESGPSDASPTVVQCADDVPESCHSDCGASEMGRFSEASAPISVDMASVTDTHSAYRDGGHTQEVTTTCVAALLRERSSRSRASSMASSVFEEPTYTMQLVQREVIGMFSEDTPKRNENFDDDELPLGADSHSLLGMSSVELNSMSNIVSPLADLPCRQETSVLQHGSSFEIFEDTGIIPGEAGGDEDVGHNLSGGSGGWGDDEFNAMMN